MTTHLERRELHFSGHVQGVGFRYRTRQLAAAHRVTGYVRNLSDGRVELVAEGAPAELDLFLAALAAELGEFIRSTQTFSSPANGEFFGFEIRY